MRVHRVPKMGSWICFLLIMYAKWEIFCLTRFINNNFSKHFCIVYLFSCKKWKVIFLRKFCQSHTKNLWKISNHNQIILVSELFSSFSTKNSQKHSYFNTTRSFHPFVNRSKVSVYSKVYFYFGREDDGPIKTIPLWAVSRSITFFANSFTTDSTIMAFFTYF